MIHQVLAYLAAQVSYSLGRPGTVPRHKQEFGCLNGMSGDDEHFRGHTSRTGLWTDRFLVLHIFDLADAPVSVHYNIAGHRLRPDLDVVGVQRLLQSNAGIIFGLDRADRDAVGIAGTDAPVLIRLRVASGRSAGNR